MHFLFAFFCRGVIQSFALPLPRAAKPSRTPDAVFELFHYHDLGGIYPLQNQLSDAISNLHCNGTPVRLCFQILRPNAQQHLPWNSESEKLNNRTFTSPR